MKLFLKQLPLFALPTLAALQALASGDQKTTSPHRTAVPPTNEIFSAVVAPWSPAHPRNDHAQIFPLKDGRLMLAWSEYYVNRPSDLFRTPYDGSGTGDESPCRISARISVDRGRTWSDKMVLQDNIGANNVKQSNLFRCANGDILLLFTKWDLKGQERSVHYKRSKDDGESWSATQQLTPPGGNYLLDAGRIFVHSSGRIILPIYWTQHAWTKDERLEAFAYYSDDDGMTWQSSRNRIILPKRGSMEPAMAERSDGSILAMVRSSVGCLYESESSDRGETWAPAKPSQLASPQAEPCLVRVPGTDDLLIIWCNSVPYSMTPGTETWGDHEPRRPLTAAISRDGGRTWIHTKHIENREYYRSAYPNVFFLGREAFVTYYQASESWSRDSELVLKIYPIEWFYR